MPAVELWSLDDNAVEDPAEFDTITADYKDSIPQFLPSGFSWNVKPGGLMDKLLCALSREPSRIERRGREVLEEADVRAAQELLSDWERVLALPGNCTDPPTTLAARQAAAHAKLTQRAFSSTTYFLGLANDLGYPDAEVRLEHNPFECGRSVCGDSLRGHHGSWTYTWTLVANTTTDNDGQLQCLIREAAQAHVIVHFEFPGQATIIALP